MPKWYFDVSVESGELAIAGEVCSSLFKSPNSKRDYDNVVYGILSGEVGCKGHRPDDAIYVSHKLKRYIYILYYIMYNKL